MNIPFSNLCFSVRPSVPPSAVTVPPSANLYISLWRGTAAWKCAAAVVVRAAMAAAAVAASMKILF